jgi:phosphatidylinositol 4-kinase
MSAPKDLDKPLSMDAMNSLYHYFNTPSQEIKSDNNSLGSFEELLKLEDDEINFYLPQICNFLVHHEDNQNLLNFLLDKCGKSIYFGLKIGWMIDALSDNIIEKKCAWLKDIVYYTTYNGMKVDDEKNMSYELISKNAVSKVLRVEFFNSMVGYIEQLAWIGNYLKAVPAKDRRSELKKELLNVNDMFKKTPGKYFPLYSPSSPYHYILQICVDESIVLNSKDRAPYLLYLEVLEYDHINLSNELVHEYAKVCHEDVEKIYQNIEDTSNTEVNNNELANTNDSKPNTPQLTRRPSLLLFKESLDQKKQRLKTTSPFGHLNNWNLISVIVKVGDNCKQELFGLQLISLFQKIFNTAKLPLYLRPYDMLVISPSSCIIETIPNAISIHQLKKDNNNCSFREYFTNMCFGEENNEFEEKRRNFIESLAAYSLLCYLLQIKDRHNGNILIDTDGHLIHIDLGFMLWNTPSRMFRFETSPFKLTSEYVDFIGGKDKGLFQYYKALMLLGFLELRRNNEQIFDMIKIMIQTNTNLPCFAGGEKVIQELNNRFVFNINDKNCDGFIDKLVIDSLDSWSTIHYDKYQKLTNGILY